MRAVALVARANARSRLGSLVVLALLVVVVGAVVMAAGAGARRSATVLDRYMKATNQQDASAYVRGLSAADAPVVIGGVQGVEEVSSADYFLAEPAVPGAGYNFGILSSPDPDFGTSMSRYVMSDGRMPDPNRSDEVVLNQPAARALGLRSGDAFDAQTMSPGAFERMMTGQGGIELDGPTLSLQVVGVVQVGEDLQGSTQQSGPVAVASAAFAQRYRDKVAVNGSYSGVKISDPAAVDHIRGAVATYPESSVGTVGESWADTTRSAINVLVLGLLLFAGLALVAGAIAVGQAVSRQVSGDHDQVMVTRSIGFTRRERVLAAGLPALFAATIGMLVAVAVAASVSGLFPLSIARTAEVEPGVRIDPIALGGGFVALLGALTVWTLLSARHRDRRIVSPRAEGGSRSIGGAAGLGSRVAPRLGVRAALDRGRGGSVIPTRSALLGIVVGVAIVVGAVGFLASLNGAINTPGQFGWTWSARPDLGSGDDPKDAVEQLAADPDLSAVGTVFQGTTQIDGVTIPIETFASMKGSLAPPIVKGHLPANAGEIALGASTLESAGIELGDTLELATMDGGSQEFAVVGQVVGSQLLSSPDLGAFAVVTPDAAQRLTGAESVYALNDLGWTGNVVLTYRDGVATGPLESRLQDDYQLDFRDLSHPAPPGRLSNIDDMSPLVVGLVAFSALLGLLGLIHVLVVSTRRRAHEFGILTSLGLVRSQVRSVVTFQALTLVVVGLLIGIPLGVLVGRVAWGAAIGDIGMIVAPVTPWLTLTAVAMAALILAWLTSVAPGWWVARRRPAVLLRTE